MTIQDRHEMQRELQELTAPIMHGDLQSSVEEVFLVCKGGVMQKFVFQNVPFLKEFQTDEGIDSSNWIG